MPGDPEVVSIFCCGTKSHRDSEGEAVADMYRWCDSDRKWINDGPGSGNWFTSGTHEIPKVEHLFKEDKWASPLQWARGQGPYQVDEEWGKIKGMLGGRGTNDNVILTLQWLWLEFHKRPFRVCNLTGWSRGAVTTIAIANAMHLAGFGREGVRVNIFAYDPVPGDSNDFGGGSFETSGRAPIETLSPIVSQYHSILMENVGGLKGSVFKCISPSETALTQHRTYPLPGGHGDCVKWTKSRNPAGKIGLSLGVNFMREKGTSFAAAGNEKVLADIPMLEEYSKLRRDWLESCKWNPKNREVTYWRSGTIVNQFRENIYFINPHHFDVFRRVLPEIYDAAANSKMIDTGTLAAAKTKCPLTIPVLRYLKVLRDPSSRAADQYEDTAFEIEVLPDMGEINRYLPNLRDALRGSTNYNKTNPPAQTAKVWTLDEWKSASSVMFGSRRDQVAEIDRLLPIYHQAGRWNQIGQYRILFPIAAQIASHLTGKGVRSDRHMEMAQLGRQVLHALQNVPVTGRP